MDIIELLNQIRVYIEDTQVQIDNSEWGNCRKLDQLIKDDSMPTIYFEVIEKLKELSQR